MTRRVILVPAAISDFTNKMSYLAKREKRATQIVSDRIFGAIEFLAKKPVGRRGRVPGTYEKRVLKTNYIVAYDLPDDDTLHVLRIIHTARNWPAGAWPRDD
jgi:plasmid stabilization system protein ParE